MAAVELEHVHSEESFIPAICSHGEASVGNLVCRLQRACTRSTSVYNSSTPRYEYLHMYDLVIYCLQQIDTSIKILVHCSLSPAKGTAVTGKRVSNQIQY